MLYKRAAYAGVGGSELSDCNDALEATAYYLPAVLLKIVLPAHAQSGCRVERPGRPAGRMQTERKLVDHPTEVIE